MVPDTAIATVADARDAVAGTGGGVVLDVSPRTHTAADVDEIVAELGAALGYVRVPARELADGGVPGLLATLPPHVAVAIGGAVAGEPVPAGTIDADHVQRVTALRTAVDAMLRHPGAVAARTI